MLTTLLFMLMTEKPLFGICNSAESHPIMAALDSMKIPFFSLIHEFAEPYPTRIFEKIVQWSEEVIYPARIVKDSMIKKLGHDPGNIAILPQGLLDPDFPQGDEELRDKVTAAYERSFYPPGYSRHMAAIMASGSRVSLLKTIRTPSLVVPGRDDLLVPLACGIDTARHIPDARLEIIDGMGHNLPEALMPTLEELLANHASAAGGAPATTPSEDEGPAAANG